jgi:uncharacterized membrane protein YidH (DUF202 family)
MSDSSGEELLNQPIKPEEARKPAAGAGPEKVAAVSPDSEYLLVNKDDYLSLAASMEVLLKLVADAKKEPVHLLDDDTMRAQEAWAIKSQEPRTHLANERTFLNWVAINVQLFLIGVATQAVVPGWLGRSSSLLFGATAVLGIIYATLVFNKRSQGAFYNDHFGPMALAMIMLFAMALGLSFLLAVDIDLTNKRDEQTLSATARDVVP